jgi:hypothetical protein
VSDVLVRILLTILLIAFGVKNLSFFFPCRSETKDASANQDPDTTTTTPTAPKKFPAKATWAELIGHCQEAHPKSCEDLEKLSPSQIAELRQRMTSSKSPGFMLK